MDEYVILDIETTGLDIERSAIIEIGAILVSKGVVKEEFSSFVRHEGALPESTKRITHITEDSLRDAPPLGEVITNLQKFIQKRPVVAHNGFSFDFRMLERDGLRFGEKYDSMELAFFVLPTSTTGHNTGALSNRFRLGEVPHRALPDCKLELAIIENLQRVWREKPKKKIGALKSYAERTGWWWTQFLPGTGEDVDDITTLIKAHEPYRKETNQEQMGLGTQPIDSDQVAKFFASADTQYAEDRPEQREMAQAVAEAFNTRTHHVIEAGTGVGKSKAYLVPSVLFSLRNGIPVVISTYTKALQDQLFVKEIPHVKATIKPDLRVAVVKGKQNYVCLKKFQEFAKEALTELQQRSLYEHGQDDTRFTTRLGFLLLSSWLLETERGDWDELPYWLTERLPKRIMQDICNLDELCARDVCELHTEDRCFLAKVRLRAQDADLVIMNHAIFLTGIRTFVNNEEIIEGEESGDAPPEITFTHPVLPPVAKFVVLDEAHHLEDAATSAWTLTISQTILDRLMRQLFDGRKGARPAMDAVIGEVHSQRLIDLGVQFDAMEKDLQLEINLLFKEMLEKIIPTDASAKYTRHVSFSELSKTPDHMKPLTQVLGSIEERLRALSTILKDFAQRSSKEKTKKTLLIRAELTARIARAAAKMLSDDDYFVRYIERSGSTIELQAAPLSIAQQMKDLVYDNFKSVVLTSATITVADSFNFFANRCGTSLIEDDKVRYMQRFSSFDYTKQAQFFVPRGITYANAANERRRHFEQCSSFLRDAIIASQGGALVLCSSHEQVGQLYEALREPLASRNIWLLRQSRDQSISSVVRDFANDLNSVLIGTSSLWQGVDVPGPSLRALFIYKIPYRNPSEPILQARREEIDKRGGSSFDEYYLPLAALDLKQGFGRLIRKKTDLGIAVLLDERITQRPTLVRSFPRGVNIVGAEPPVIYNALDALAKNSIAAEIRPILGSIAV